MLDECFILVNILEKKKNEIIYFEFFLMIEKIIDNNAYELTNEMWHFLLEKV